MSVINSCLCGETYEKGQVTVKRERKMFPLCGESTKYRVECSCGNKGHWMSYIEDAIELWNDGGVK